jgi:hypothetical protein
MWAVKDPYLVKQKDRNPAACPFFNFCAQFNEETLNIAPLDIAARRPRKDQFNSSLMPSLHGQMVPFSGTERKPGLLVACSNPLDMVNSSAINSVAAHARIQRASAWFYV